jgi:hypothetical protein
MALVVFLFSFNLRFVTCFCWSPLFVQPGTNLPCLGQEWHLFGLKEGTDNHGIGRYLLHIEAGMAERTNSVSLSVAATSLIDVRISDSM